MRKSTDSIIRKRTDKIHIRRNYRKGVMIAAFAGAMLLGSSSVFAAEADQTAGTSAMETAGAVLTADASQTETAGAADTTADTMFTDRDLEQSPDLSAAVSCAVADDTDITITEEGVYVLSGTASDAVVYVEADDSARIQLVLDGLTVTNGSLPCIYVKSADKVFVTTVSDSSLSVTGTFTADGDTNTDGVIFSKSDLVLNGTARLSVSSTDNGIVSKDDLKVTGGSYTVSAASKDFEANDSIRIAGGDFAVTAGTDAFHAENVNDDTLGYIYIEGGTFTIESGDDGIHSNAYVQIENGTFDIKAAEGIESTYILINDGTINIEAYDDGINAAFKSNAYRSALEINGGDITVNMASGDTDGIDSNGDLTITGGTIDVTGPSTFDIDGTITFTGGTVIANGQQVTSIPTQMMSGRGSMQGRDFGGMNGKQDMQGMQNAQDMQDMQGRGSGGMHGRGTGGMQNGGF